MFCTKHIIIFSLRNSFPIVFSGEEDNTILKLFAQKKTTTEYYTKQYTLTWYNIMQSKADVVKDHMTYFG